MSDLFTRIMDQIKPVDETSQGRPIYHPRDIQLGIIAALGELVAATQGVMQISSWLSMGYHISKLREELKECDRRLIKLQKIADAQSLSSACMWAEERRAKKSEH